jgi:antitoxin (DNA-binding transcriptional repressor) of toxin-antitoxin stability system
MRRRRVTTHEAKTHLSRLLADVERGEEILISRGKKLVARIVSAGDEVAKMRPKVGTVTSDEIEISKGALEPLSDEALKEWGI